jgi:hypothetical protein
MPLAGCLICYLLFAIFYREAVGRPDTRPGEPCFPPRRNPKQLKWATLTFQKL